MRIQNNITAMNTHRQYTINNENVAKNAEKLSSGYRINRAGDDAAGLAISEKMRSQIRGLNMATKNSQDAISLVQTAEGALQETQNMLQRMNELAVQAATGTNEDLDRTALAKEFEQLKREINDIAEQTTFNNMKVLDGSMSYKGYARSAQTAGVTFTEQTAIGNTTGASTPPKTDETDAVTEMTGSMPTGTMKQALAAGTTVTWEATIPKPATQAADDSSDSTKVTFSYTVATEDANTDLETLAGTDGLALTSDTDGYSATLQADGTLSVKGPEGVDLTGMEISVSSKLPDGSDGPISGSISMSPVEAPDGSGDDDDTSTTAPITGNVALSSDKSEITSTISANLNGKSVSVGFKFASGKTEADLDGEDASIAKALDDGVIEIDADSVTVGYTAALSDDGKNIVFSVSQTQTQSGTLDPTYGGNAANGVQTLEEGEDTDAPSATNGVTAEKVKNEDGTSTMTVSGLENAEVGDTVSIGGKYFTFIEKKADESEGTEEEAGKGDGSSAADAIDVEIAGANPTNAEIAAAINKAFPDGSVSAEVKDGKLAITGADDKLTLSFTPKGGTEQTIEVKDGDDVEKKDEPKTPSGDTKDVTFELDYAKMKTGDEFEITVGDAKITVKAPGKGEARADWLQNTVAPEVAKAAGAELKGNSIIFRDVAVETKVSATLTKDITTEDGKPGNTKQADNYKTNALRIQVGALENEQLNVSIDAMTTAGLGIDDAHLTVTGGTTEEQQDAAGAAITAVRNAINKVSDQRATLGAMQNRLDHKIANLKVSSENLSAAESRIRDVDMASEMTEFTKNNILSQAATAMLAQANALPQNVLSLLG